MREGGSSWDECVMQWIVHEVIKGRHVQVGECGQSPTEIGRTLLCAEDTPKTTVMSLLQIQSWVRNKGGE